MVSSEHDKLIRKYVANFAGVYELKMCKTSCDRCSEAHSEYYVESILNWMHPGYGGAPPYLCIDCARHYGLVW
ncbi:hypothetical protein LCGC14_0592890 [marine sediment metagenome]|uniref:Uncharacterized protein n=1 Tax=marine sediment metagenome TaxID=412755 RepID=A0A0F9TZ37_9ZZZZ